MQTILNELSVQFLCGLPIGELSFPNVNLNLEDQEALVNATVNSDLVLKHPLKVDYQKAFLKRVLDTCEKQCTDIHEDLYCSYARLVAVSESKSEYFKHYKIRDNRRTISLKENVHLISDGTTGLRTWQASLALAEWCLNNKDLLHKKNILELGSGIGLTGLAAALECQPNTYSFSDCHPSVLETLCENIKVNCKNVFTNNNCVANELKDGTALNKQLQNGVNISVLNLPWEDVNELVCEKLGRVDFILAADVVYDSGLFKPLIDALKCISEKCRVGDIVFACTERNCSTLEKFLCEIGEYFEINEENCPKQKNFVWSSAPPVRIFRFLLL